MAKRIGELMSDKNLSQPSRSPDSIEDYEYAERVKRYCLTGVPKLHQLRAIENKGVIDGHADWIKTGRAVWAIIAKKPSIVCLVGDRGQGKTQMMANIIYARSIAEISSKYVLAMGLFLEMRSHDRNASESAIVHKYLQPGLLVIDEIQERGRTEWEDRVLTHLIDLRYGDCKATVIVGHLESSKLPAHLGVSIMSRMVEAGHIIECTWPSYRGKK